MVVALDIGIDTKAIKKQFDVLQKKILPKTQSIALERAVSSGAKAMAADGRRQLDSPIKAVFNGKKARNRLGWIYWEFDDRKDIKRKGGDGGAFVQLQGQGNAKARDEQQTALHSQIYGDTVREGVTPAVPYIIRPSRRLRQERKIRGLPFIRIDTHGNIFRYRQSMKKALGDPRFIHIGLNEGRGRGGRNKNGLKLPPGLYFRQERVRRYKRNKHTKRYGGPYGGTGKKKRTFKIITVLRYQRIRDYKPKWDFKAETRKAMNKAYSRAFIQRLNIEIRREFKNKGRNARPAQI